MDNITQLYPTNKPEAFSNESELYFDVWERPSYFRGQEAYYEDPNHKHIVRSWHGEPTSIGLVGKNYKVLHTKDVCEGVEDTFMEVMSSEDLLEITSFQTLPQISGHNSQISPFELSLLMGMMVHPHSSFITEQSTFSVRMEWSQDHMI